MSVKIPVKNNKKTIISINDISFYYFAPFNKIYRNGLVGTYKKEDYNIPFYCKGATFHLLFKEGNIYANGYVTKFDKLNIYSMISLNDIDTSSKNLIISNNDKTDYTHIDTIPNIFVPIPTKTDFAIAVFKIPRTLDTVSRFAFLVGDDIYKQVPFITDTDYIYINEQMSYTQLYYGDDTVAEYMDLNIIKTKYYSMNVPGLKIIGVPNLPNLQRTNINNPSDSEKCVFIFENNKWIDPASVAPTTTMYYSDESPLMYAIPFEDKIFWGGQPIFYYDTNKSIQTSNYILLLDRSNGETFSDLGIFFDKPNPVKDFNI